MLSLFIYFGAALTEFDMAILAGHQGHIGPDNVLATL